MSLTEEELLAKLPPELKRTGAFFRAALERLRRGELFEEYLTANDFTDLIKVLVQPGNLKKLDVIGIKVPDLLPSPITQIGTPNMEFGNDVSTPTAKLVLNDVKGKQETFLGDVQFSFNSVNLNLVNNPNEKRMIVVSSIITDPVNISTPVGERPAAPELMGKYGNQLLYQQTRSTIEKLLAANNLKMSGFGFGIQALPNIASPQPSDLRIRIAIKP